MPYNYEYDHYRLSSVKTLATQVAATVKVTTSLFATAITNLGDYNTMGVYAKVTSNTTAAPSLKLQVSPDNGTTWFNSITIDADMTTTANNTFTNVTDWVGDTVRVICAPGTSSSIVAYTVYARLKG
jgi:hypothetical protein